MKALFPRVTIDDLSGLRALGVDAAYVRKLRRAGVPLASPDDAIAYRAVDGGVDVSRIVSNAVSVATSASSVSVGQEIGRAHVCTPDTHAHLVCRLLLEKIKIES